ncbi:MAG: branched-chain amino acid ABC transporter permease [Candidatus Methylomirabilales bacterium]
MRLGIGVLLVAFAAGLVVLPFVGPYFVIFVATEILIMGLFATSFNLLFGYTGLLSFGHAAYFGTGAYVAALLLRDVQPDFIWVLVAGAVGAGLLALAIGYLCVHLNEVYFAMLTLAFGMMMFAVFHQWRSLTGGSDGVAGFPITDLGLGFDAQLANPVHFYYLTLVVASISAFLLYRITVSPFGLILRAMRENTERVAFAGIPAYRYRLYAFGLSGLFSGVAGALFAPFNRIAVPDMAHWTQSAEPVLMTILGGAQYFFGPLFGSAVFLILKQWITTYTEEWMIYLGVILAFMVIVLPRGFLGLFDRWLRGRS